MQLRKENYFGLLLRVFKKSKITLYISAFFLINNLIPAASALNVSSQFGKVQTEIPSQNGKTLILIEESHADYGVQKAISGILEELMKQSPLRRILVEGGWGDDSLSSLRSYGTREGRLKAAEIYLKAGKISGEEYLNITSFYSMKIWGIENPDFYAENMDAFIKLDNQKEKITAELTGLERIFTGLQERTFSEELSGLMKKRAAFKTQKNSLADYVQVLQQRVSKKDLQEFPSLQKFMGLLGQEGKLDPEKVEFEKQALIRHLSRHLAKPEFETLQVLEAQPKGAGELRSVEALLQSYRKHPEAQGALSIKNLESYAQALKAAQNLEGASLFEELESLEQKIFQSLTRTENEKELLRISFHFETLEKLLELQLTPRDFEKIQSGESLLEETIKSLKSFQGSLPETKEIQSAFPFALLFYRSAQKREGALIANAFKKIQETKDASVALIAGGFHSAAIVKAFQDRGYGVIKIQPHFEIQDEAAQHSHYLNILKTKWEMSRLQKKITPSSDVRKDTVHVF